MKSIKLACSAIFLLYVIMWAGCLHEPVDEDYYLDISKVKGQNKPEPPPVIRQVYRVGNEVIIDFSETTTIDPDTGSAHDLFYLFYASSKNPADFHDERLYYDKLYYIGYIAHGDLGENFLIRVDIGDYLGGLYFWMTAYDGGRESDHSNVVYILIQ